MPDTPQRIATDTSQKLAIRFGETIKAYMASDELEASDLKLIPLVFAGWLRYLMAVDDNGNAFEPSSDPMLAELTPYLKDIKWNDEQAEKKILPILAKSEIFGVNLASTCLIINYRFYTSCLWRNDNEYIRKHRKTRSSSGCSIK